MESLSFVSAACTSCDVGCRKKQNGGRDLYILSCNMDKKNGTLWLGMEILKWVGCRKSKTPLPTEKTGRGNTLLKCEHKDEGKFFNTNVYTQMKILLNRHTDEVEFF
jgi:hypothetical protein